MIKLELNSTDELALRHFGTALTNMAVELNGQELGREPVDPKPTQPVETVTGADTSTECETQDVTVSQPDVDPTKDVNGLPWDERIHSSSKAKIQNGSWKKRKGVDDETRATVEAELRALMAIPVTPPEADFTEEVAEHHMSLRDAQVIDPKPETVAQDVETVQADAIASRPETEATPPPPPPVTHESVVSTDPAVQEVVVPKPQDETPPPPPVIDDAPVGNTPVDVAEPVKFVDVTKFITSVMVAQKGMSMPAITKSLQDKFGVPFPALAKRPEILPQVMEFLHNEADTK